MNIYCRPLRANGHVNDRRAARIDARKIYQDVFSRRTEQQPNAGNDALFTSEDVAASITVLGNDSDLDGHNLSVTSTSVPMHGTVIINANNTYVPTHRQLLRCRPVSLTKLAMGAAE